MRVMPVDTFERAGQWIVSGHYIIDFKGTAVVVHCGNLRDQRVSVQFMFGEPVAYPTARDTIEPMLIGMLVACSEQQETVFEQKRLSDTFKDQPFAFR